jgi:hypothetical protein
MLAVNVFKGLISKIFANKGALAPLDPCLL